MQSHVFDYFAIADLDLSDLFDASRMQPELLAGGEAAMPSHEEFCATCSGRIFRAKPLSNTLGSRLHLHSNAHEEKMRHFLRIVTLVMAPRAEHARPLGIALITRINPKRTCHRAHEALEALRTQAPTTLGALSRRCSLREHCKHRDLPLTRIASIAIFRSPLDHYACFRSPATRHHRVVAALRVLPLARNTASRSRTWHRAHEDYTTSCCCSTARASARPQRSQASLRQ